MSSAPSIPTPPLPSGHYYLVDISEAIDEYMQVPFESRMCTIAEGAAYSQEDMLDIELEAIIPVLNERDNQVQHITEHVESLLDDGKDLLEDMMERQREITGKFSAINTPEQLEHAQAVDTLAHRVADVLKEHNLYNEHGELVGEHCTVLEGGLLVLRSRY